MKITVADCSAVYSGRGDTVLPRGIRSIIVKNDGSVSIHNDAGIKPINYMKEAKFSEYYNSLGERIIVFEARREILSITIHQHLSNFEAPLMKDDPGLQRDGTEDQLQEWLSKHMHVFGNGFSLVRREYPTGQGPVDLLLLDDKNIPVAVEVKRIAMIGAVDQVRRYLDALKNPQEISNNDTLLDLETNLSNGQYDFTNTYGILIAQDIRPNTLKYAEKHNIKTLLVPEDWKSQ